MLMLRSLFAEPSLWL